MKHLRTEELICGHPAFQLLMLNLSNASSNLCKRIVSLTLRSNPTTFPVQDNILCVQEVLTHFIYKLIYKMDQDFLDILYSKLLYKSGQDFLNKQCVISDPVKYFFFFSF